MTMQDNIDIARRKFRRNMNEPKSQTFPGKINNHRPVFVPVAVSADNRQRRPDRFQIERDRGLANIAKVPNFIRLRSHIQNCGREFVMSISENKNLHRTRKSQTSKPKSQGNSNAQVIEAIRGHGGFAFFDLDLWDLFGAWDLGFGISGA